MQATPNAPLALAVHFRVAKLGAFSDMAGAPDAQPNRAVRFAVIRPF